LKLTGELVGADTLLGAAHHEDGIDPLSNRDMRAFEDRARGYAELLAASATLPLLANGFLAARCGGVADLIDLLAAFAERALYAVRPTQIGERVLSGGFVGEEAGDVCDAVDVHEPLYSTQLWSKQVHNRQKTRLLQ